MILQNGFTTIRLTNRALATLTLCGLGLFLTSFVAAQTEVKTDTASSSSADDSVQAQTALKAQTALVRSIFDATKKTRTEKDYTAFLEKCQDALDQDLSSKNRQYINSLTGWALNRRGEKRFELATQLKKIGNNQYDTVVQQVMEDFNQAIIAAPDRYRSWMSRGIAHMFVEETDKAILDFTEVVKLKTDEPNGWFNRAEALHQRGNFEHAIKDYNVALRLNSDDAEALTGRGHSLFALKQFEKALADFQQAVTLSPDVDAAFINRGDTHQQLGEWELAEKDYEKAIKIKETAVACQRFAWLKATCPDTSIRDNSGAKKLIDRAIELAGESTTNLDTLAAVEAANGDFESAQTVQKKVIKLVTAELDVEPSDGETGNAETEPYEARLMLYQESEPFTQPAGGDSD